jgi:hypothetical protein
MRRLKAAWNWLLPRTEDRQVRARAGLVVGTCLGVGAACVLIIVGWAVTGTLEDWETIVAAVVLAGLLAGIVLLARAGRVRLAAWLLVGLLALLIAADVAGYGLGSPTAAAFCIPIVLAACALGLWAGLGVAAFASLAIWLIATAGLAGWYTPQIAPDVSYLSFEAPVMTVILLAVALMVGGWTRSQG